MSHFAVAVITKHKPSHAVLEQVLQPFHEFECTGEKDQYVIPFDETEEKREEYENDTIDGVFTSAGEFLGSMHDKQFEQYWQRVNKSDQSKEYTFVIPAGMDQELKTVPVSQVLTFKQWLEDCEGYSLDGVYTEFTEDGKFLRYTNPNARWDYWRVGGRWNNMLRTKSGKQVDSAKLSSLDFKGEQDRLRTKYSGYYDYFLKCLGDLAHDTVTWETWGEIHKNHPDLVLDAKRELYFNQAPVAKVKEADLADKKLFQFMGMELDTFRCSRDEYLANNIPAPFQAYNVLLQSEANTDHLGWYGGDMGWFGCGNQKDTWNKTYEDLIRSQPQDHWITVVDCHI